MGARFLIEEAFRVKTSHAPHLALCGKVVTGTIRQGMEIIIPLNSGTDVTLPVYAIEFARRAAGGPDAVCLLVICETDEELQILLGLNLRGDEVEIHEPRTAPGV